MNTRSKVTSLTPRILNAILAALLTCWAGSAAAQSTFTHQLPLKLPKGAHGFQPELALVYSSAAGNGPLGMGWQLTGQETITRVNYGKGIRYAGGDTFAHSQLGVLVRQLDGTYRSFKESFTRFAPSAALCGDAPCSWSAVDRSGVTHFFGTTPDSVLVKSGTSSVRTWGLSSVQDPFGNHFDTTYNTAIRTVSGRLVPDNIQYTMGNGQTVFRKVTFSYVSGRADTEPGYPQGDPESMGYLLTNIAVVSYGVSVNGTVLHQYVLTYGTGAVTGRSRLTQVQEFGPTITTPLLNQTFAWSQGTENTAAGLPTMGPDLMTSVDNGTGGVVTISYSPAPQVANAIQPTSTNPGIASTAPRQLETQVTVNDGRGGSYTTHFEYSDGRTMPGTVPAQRDLGFAFVDTVDNQTGLRKRNYYRQDPPYEGMVNAEYTWTATTPAYTLAQTARYYQPLANLQSIGTEYVVEYQTNTYTYEMGAIGFQRVDSRTFDQYGNTTSLSQDAGPYGLAYNLPNVTVATTYLNNPVSWVLGQISEIKTTSGVTLLAWSQNVWNNDQITAKSEWMTSSSACPSGCWITTSMGYDVYGNMTSVTEPSTGDALTRRTVTTFDSKYHAYPTAVTNALNQASSRTFNEDGLVATSTDVNGRVTAYTYDIYGRKASETRPDGGVTQYAYVNYGNPNSQYDETVTYVDATRVLWKREFFDGSGFKYNTYSSGDCGATTTVAGKTYQYVTVSSQKDSAGRPYMNSLPYCGGGTPVWSTTVYDVAGRPSYVQQPDGKSFQYTYGIDYHGTIDANLKETRKYFDARDQVTTVVFPYGDPAAQTTTYTYDPLRRISSILLPDHSSVSYTYDSLNHRTSVSAPVGLQQVTTTYAYDAIGNVVSTSSAGKTVTMTYDALNRVNIKQPQNETASLFTYDEPAMQNGIGRVTTVLDAGGATKVSYTVNGQILGRSKTIDAKNFTQTYTYDLAGRVTRLTYPDGSYADYAYFDGGNLASLSLNCTPSIPCTPFGSWAGYDASGRPGAVTLGNGVATAYGYDTFGHLSSLVTSKGATTIQNLAYDWYSLPNTAGLTVGSITDNRASKAVGGYNTDESQTYTYDSLGRLTQANGVWGTKSYVFDTMGDPTAFGGVVNRSLTYTGQQVTGGTGLSGVSYDATGNMITKTLDGVTWGYTWTAEGQLASVTRGGLTAAQMTYDANAGRVKKVFTPSTGPSVTTTYFFDQYEKRTFSDGSPEVHTLRLVANGQILASVTRTGTILTASNSEMGWRQQWALGSLYNPASMKGMASRVGWYSAGLVNHPLTQKWFGFSVLASLFLLLAWAFARSLAARLYQGSMTAWARAVALGVLFAFAGTACTGGGPNSVSPPGSKPPSLDLTGNTTSGPPAGTAYYHRNQINSSTVITDGAGTEVSRIVYLPFGEISQPNSAGADIVSAKFTGKELDEETGLYFYGARYYDPAIGRFISADSVIPSLTDAQAFNRYSYVKNNPVAYVDPSGHFFEFIGKIFHAIENAVSRIGDAIAQAVRWIGTAISDVGKFLDKAAGIAWQFTKAMAKDPSTYLSLALAICSLNPAVVAVWFISTAASIAAESLAVAAGVKNQLVVSLIASIAGAAGAGASSAAQFAKTVGAWAVGQGLQRLEQKEWGGKVTQWLGVINSMISSQIVNAAAGKASWLITPFGAMDPPGGSPDASASASINGVPTLGTDWSDMSGSQKAWYVVTRVAVVVSGAALIVMAVGAAPILTVGAGLLFGAQLTFGILGASWAAADLATTAAYGREMWRLPRRRRHRRTRGGAYCAA